MNLAKFQQAIYDRLTGDATLTGLATGGVRSVLGPRTGISTEDSKPYVVVTLQGTTPADDFRGDLIEMVVDVHVVSDTTDGLSTPSSIIDRIIGDATLQSNVTPTYGLHRHQLSLSGSTYTGGVMQFFDTETAHDEERLHFILGFKVYQGRTAP